MIVKQPARQQMPVGNMSNQRIYSKNIFLFLACCFIFLATAEITLRFIKPIPSFCKIDLFSYGAEYSLSPNQKVIYVPKPNSGEFNVYGHRGKQFPFKKTDKKRILVIGDSVVEGFGVPIEDRFTEKLGNILGSQYEVINLGVRGYNLFQEFEYFKMLGAKFSADIVLWGVAYNDLILDSGEVRNLDVLLKKMENNHFYKEYYRAKSQIDKIMAYSYLYSYIRHFGTLISKKDFAETAYYEIKVNETRDLLRRLKEFSRKDNFKLIFVFLPTNTPQYADKMRLLEGLVKSEGIASLNLNAYFGSGNTEQLFFPRDPCHLNSVGHLKVARALYEIIRKMGSDLFFSI